MARIRSIKPDFFTSDDIVTLSPLSRLLYIGLWCEADREGRFVWVPKTFKRRYLPEDDCDIECLCQELRDQRLVVLYGDTLAYIPTFSKHQHINPRETVSVLPTPDDATVTRGDASVTHREEGKEGKGRERKYIPQERKKSLPADWAVTEEDLAYASAQGCPDPSGTAEKFKLYHRKNGTKHVDWHAAFQYWCRNEKDFRQSSKPPEIDHLAGVDY